MPAEDADAAAAIAGAAAEAEAETFMRRKQCVGGGGNTDVVGVGFVAVGKRLRRSRKTRELFLALTIKETGKRMRS